MIHISSDWSEVDREIDRISSMPDMKMTQSLKHVLDFGFTLTQSSVHVLTGALKASGTQKTDKDRATHTWTGEIVYGDAGGPVDYAIYEKRRGVHWVGASAGKGDHDFLRPLKVIEPMFTLAIKEGLAK